MARHVTRVSAPTPSTQNDLSAGVFNSLLEAFERVRIPLAQDEARAAAEREREAVKALIDRQITDARWRELMHRAREAAERGEHEYLLLRFPSDTCTDRGRAITEKEPSWSSTLTGDAAWIHRRWQDELDRRGFRLTARILEFSGGVPGDVGLFLRWGP